MKIINLPTLIVFFVLLASTVVSTAAYFREKRNSVEKCYLCIEIGWKMSDVGFDLETTRSALQATIGPRPEKAD